MPNEHPTARRSRRRLASTHRQETISNFKVACVIGMALMPAGVVLDASV